MLTDWPHDEDRSWRRAERVAVVTGLLAAAGLADPAGARSQKGLSLGWHIIIACFGVGLPALAVFGEWRGQRSDDPCYRLLARRWAQTPGTFFAVCANAWMDTATGYPLRAITSRSRPRPAEARRVAMPVTGTEAAGDRLAFPSGGFGRLRPTVHRQQAVAVAAARPRLSSGGRR